MQDKPKPESLKGCLGILIMLAGLVGLIYSVPQLAKAIACINPIDRQTIILSAVLIIATGARKAGAK